MCLFIGPLRNAATRREEAHARLLRFEENDNRYVIVHHIASYHIIYHIISYHIMSYIYIYIYIERERERYTRRPPLGNALQED